MRTLDFAKSETSRTPETLWALVAGSAPLNRALAVIALLALTLSPIIGTLAAATFIGAAVASIVLRPADIGSAMVRFWPIFVLPLIALSSTLWSDAPERTLRAAIQLLITFVAALAICRQLDGSTMISALFGGFLAVDLLALTTINRSLSSGLPMLGPFASKNAMGYTAQMSVALALAVVFDPRQRSVWRILALASIPMTTGLLVLSQSAGAMIAAVLATALFLTLALLVKTSKPVRIALTMFAFFLSGAGALASSTIEETLNDFRQDVLHKDATLTGRTYLWEYADGLSRQRPALGHGYYAFWREGNIEAEGLWRWGGIRSRNGFNFHSAAVEMKVDLGLVGVAALIASGVAVLGFALVRQLVAPSVPMAFLIAVTIVSYIRSYGETGLIAPFSLLTVLWLATLFHGALCWPRTAPAAGSAVRGRSRVARVPRFGAARR